MPNIAAALKQEIARVARKETKGELDSVKRAAAGYRKQIADLKRRMQALERQVAGGRQRVKAAAPEEEHEGGLSLRFRPEGLKKHRQRLGLSANEVGKLLGVSQLSVYKWESGRTHPRAKQLQLIAQLRTMGKKEAAKRLEEQA